MRLAVASDDGASIAGHFGRCAGFLVFDVENGEAKMFEYRPNTFGHHHHGQHDQQGQHGHDHDHTEEHHTHTGFIGALSDCQVVICRGMGRRALADLAANGIQPAITSEDVTAVEAATRYAAGGLSTSSDSSCCSH